MIVLDSTGAALIPNNAYDNVRSELIYFGRRINKLYNVPINNGAICLGAKPNFDKMSISAIKTAQQSLGKGRETARRETVLRKAKQARQISTRTPLQ